MMNMKPWRSEWLRFLGAIALIPLIYQITGYWWLSIALVLTIYLAFLWYNIHAIHQWLNEGMPNDKKPELGGILGQLITLIYGYKKATDNANKQQKTLIKQFNETISAIPSATIVLNRNNEIEWANYPALTLLGINGQRDIGIKIDSLLRQTDFVRHLRKNKPQQFEVQSPVSDNLTLAVQIVNYAERKRLLLAHNITPHIEVQHSRKTFIANASHELRTPLTVIAGYLEFIHSDPTLSEQLKQPVEKAQEQSHSMETLINDLLTLSRLEDKEIDPKSLSHIKVKDHLNHILQTLEAGGKTQGFSILANAPDDLYLTANEKELDSVCYNLINNAIKYSDKNRQIDISWEKRPNKQLCFSVIDQGIGIAPEHIARLTERFYRVDSGRSRRVGGTGLGLSIVKHIIERHNGFLEVHSTLGEGSTFSAIFPSSPNKRTVVRI